MFHIHIEGASSKQWLSGYDGNEYSNSVMGEWFLNYSRPVQVYICFINHPVYPV